MRGREGSVRKGRERLERRLLVVQLVRLVMMRMGRVAMGMGMAMQEQQEQQDHHHQQQQHHHQQQRRTRVRGRTRLALGPCHVRPRRPTPGAGWGGFSSMTFDSHRCLLGDSGGSGGGSGASDGGESGACRPGPLGLGTRETKMY